MSSLNKCCFIGNLGKDVDIRSTADGKEIANFSLGVSETWKDKNTGERKSITEWVKVVIFNPNLVTVAKNYLKKGSKVYLEGQMKTRKYTDSSGVEKYSTEIVLQNFGGTLVMLDSKNEAQAVPAASAPKSFDSTLDDEIPF